jgi:hypothetical protein
MTTSSRTSDDLYQGSKRRQFVQGYQEALRDLVDKAIENADNPLLAMLQWMADNADNDTTRERVARVSIWLEVDAAAPHTPTGRTELGYTRQVCGTCGTDWPCPTAAQAAEAVNA